MTLYIAGTQRSGTTLLSILLGRHPEVVNVGETLLVSDRLQQGATCGCGLQLGVCPFWVAVLERLEPVVGGVEGVLALHRESLAVAGASVVVDMSKRPDFIAHVATEDDLVVHLVRDPRALAWSRHRRSRPSAPHPRLRGVVVSSLVWAKVNRRARGLVRRSGGRTVRYEDLCADPEEVCAGLWQLLGLSPVTGGWGTQHFVAGNALLKQRGEAPVQLDETWRTTLPARHQVIALLAAGPSAWRVGYRLSS